MKGQAWTADQASHLVLEWVSLLRPKVALMVFLAALVGGLLVVSNGDVHWGWPCHKEYGRTV